MQPLGQGTNLVSIEAVAQRMQVLEVSVQRSSYEPCRAGTLPLGSLHRVERGRVGNRKVVQVSLEVFVRGKTETLNNSHGCSRVRAQTSGERAHAEQDIGTGILQNRTNDFLALWTEMSEFIGETSVRGGQPRLRPFTSHDLGRIAYRVAACQRIP